MTNNNSSSLVCPECGEGDLSIEISMSYTASPVSGSHVDVFVVNKSEVDNLADWSYDALCEECGWFYPDVEVELA